MLQISISSTIEATLLQRARIGRLAHQRIDLSYIDCKDDLVYHGGHATVSKGTVVPKYVSLWDSFSGNFFMGIRGMGRWFEHKLVGKYPLLLLSEA